MQIFSVSTGIISDYQPPFPEKEILKSLLFFDKYHILGTDKGLYFYDLNLKKIVNILTNVQILSLYKGTQQIIWVGTDMQGVWMLSPLNDNFVSYTSENIENFGNCAVRCFIELNENELWVGTKGEGIFVFDIVNRVPKFFHKKNITINDGLSSNSVFSMVSDECDVTWIGTDGRGMNYYSAVENKIFTLQVPKEIENKIKLVSIYAILPFSNNVLWVGTSGYGLYKLEIDRSVHPYSIKSFKQYVYDSNINSISNNIVYSIIRDDIEHLWIGTRGGGLNRFNINTETFQIFRFSANNPHFISNDDILCLHKSKSSNLWIGTSMGLNKLEKIENEIPVFSRYTEHDGLPNNTIHGILEDAEQNLWLSSNRGLIKFNKSDNVKIVSYFKKDGLQNNEFSDGAFYKSKFSPNLYFGGISGFNVFNPYSLKATGYMPPLFLSSFSIQNVEVNLQDYLKIKKNKPTLVLKNSQKLISFRFILLDYLSGVKCEIKYILEGFHNEQIHLGTSSTIVLSNLPTGKYRLKVTGSNADKIWSEEFFELPIIMLPPWYLTVWAFLCYAALLSIISLIIFKQLKYRTKAKNEIKAKELENLKSEEIHQAKLRFFTNIAHEFSNSLTLIYAPCEQLSTLYNDEKSRKYINSIRVNSKRMQSLIQELIEFRKAETGFLKINITSVDIQELIKFVSDSFIENLEQKKISLTIDFQDNFKIWNTDRDCFEKIVFNLISNAAKYTPTNERITISVKEIEKNLVFTVTNTGIGIKNSNSKIIFDRFKVLEQFEMQLSEGFETRSGIGLAVCKSIVEKLDGKIEIKSDEKSYTTFIVTLPHKETEITEPDNFNKSGIKHTFFDDEYEFESENQNLEFSQMPRTTLLIVDDDKEIRKLVKNILSHKFDVIEAIDGKDAIDAMKKKMPHIIISDVIMPNMSGIEFVSLMKTQELTRHIPIIMLSNKNSIESQIEGISTGADGYIAKPFHPRHLEVLIDSLLNRNKAVVEYSNSHLAGLEQYEGKMIHKEDKELLTRLNRIIFDNIDEEILSLEFIANEVAFSKIQLYRKIKELTGKTPTEYIRSIRLEQAEKLLKTTNKTVSEIMYDCGFNNKAYFFREFSKKTGKTPGEYREFKKTPKSRNPQTDEKEELNKDISLSLPLLGKLPEGSVNEQLV